ncbi:hypothetical protein F4802DRAFT_240280 [Xylaria palmicola]|nr:hypothetical protein F4802DRAFT_240280 [Xylaria palmicola]
MTDAELPSCFRTELARPGPRRSRPPRSGVVDYVVPQCAAHSSSSIANTLSTTTSSSFAAPTASGSAGPHVQLMRDALGSGVGIKAAGGIRTLNELLVFVLLGASRVRIKAAVTKTTFKEEAVARGIRRMPVRILLPPSAVT